MRSRTARARHGNEIALDLRQWVGRQLRTARRAAGLSQAAVAHEAGMSRSQLGRIERTVLARPRLDQVARAFAALGLKLALTAYPDGDPAWDAGQQRLLGRFRQIVPAGGRLGTEVPLPLPGDRRAWDARIDLRGRRAGCELEARLRDVQATERKLALKLRDGGVDVLILVLADTPSNRAVLVRHREALRPLLPLDTREVLAAFRRGELPGASGICVL